MYDLGIALSGGGKIADAKSTAEAMLRMA